MLSAFFHHHHFIFRCNQKTKIHIIAAILVQALNRSNQQSNQQSRLIQLVGVAMPSKLQKFDSLLSNTSRFRLRESNEAAMVRKTGPTIKPYEDLTDSGKRHRERNRASVEHILWGAGCARCGTTCLARNCQDAGGRISHERGNVRAADHDEDDVRDRFYYGGMDSDAKRNIVERMITSWLDAAGAKQTVGDVSLANSLLMIEALEYDPRVKLVVLLRELESWIESIQSLGQCELSDTQRFKSLHWKIKIAKTKTCVWFVTNNKTQLNHSCGNC